MFQANSQCTSAKKDPEKKRMFKLFFIHVGDFEKQEGVRSFLKKRLVNGSSLSKEFCPGSEKVLKGSAAHL